MKRLLLSTTVAGRMMLPAATFLPLAPLAILAACANSGTPVTVQSVSQDVTLIATGLNNALSAPSVTALIPAATLPKIQQALSDLNSLATQVAASPSAAAQKGSVAVIEQDVNTIVSALAGLPGLPPNVSTILTAATVLLPVIEVAVGLVVPAGAATAAMTPDAARMHLAAGR